MAKQEEIMFNIRYWGSKKFGLREGHHVVVGFIYGEGVPQDPRHPDVPPEIRGWDLNFTWMDVGSYAADRFRAALQCGREMEGYVGREVLVFSETPKKSVTDDTEVPRAELQEIVEGLSSRIPQLSFRLKDN